jgi:hypothetical protein
MHLCIYALLQDEKKRKKGKNATPHHHFFNMQQSVSQISPISSSSLQEHLSQSCRDSAT